MDYCVLIENSISELRPLNEIKHIALCEVDDDLCLKNMYTMEYSITSLFAKSNSIVSRFNLNPNTKPFIPNTSKDNCNFSASNICKGNYALNYALHAPSVLNSHNDISIIADNDNDHIENCDEDLEILSKIKTKNLNNVVLGLLNVNSFNAKFDSIRSIAIDKIDVMVLVETKLDDTCPTSQFFMGGYSRPFRRDRNRYGGGILIYVREDIPCKILHDHNLPEDIEGIFLN